MAPAVVEGEEALGTACRDVHDAIHHQGLLRGWRLPQLAHRRVVHGNALADLVDGRPGTQHVAIAEPRRTADGDVGCCSGRGNMVYLSRRAWAASRCTSSSVHTARIRRKPSSIR